MDKQLNNQKKDFDFSGNSDVAEGSRDQVEHALQIEDEKHLKEVIKPRPDHKTETNLH